jgi:nucleoside-diphosphate-sugar epimerase
MKIAITGATGFIGSYLAKMLSKDFELIFFDRSIHSLNNVLSLRNFVKDADVVIHLAGLKNDIDIANIYITNVLGTTNLLEALSLYGKKNALFIFSSTFLIYQENFQHIRLKEESAVLPRGHYGISKLFAEQIIEYYHRFKKVKGVVLRIANVYGPVISTPGLSAPNLFIENIIHNKPVTIRGSKLVVRDFIYLEDIFNAINLIINNPKEEFLKFNICTGKETKITELIKVIEKRVGKKAHLEIDQNYKKNAYWIGDNSKMFYEYGFKPKIDIRKGIELTLNL